jgi:hypothetical protein
MLDSLEVYNLIKKHLSYFCESCKRVCFENQCDRCQKSDLPFIASNNEVDYSSEVLLSGILKNLNPVNQNELFDEYLSELYGNKIKVGYGIYELVDTLRSVDPYSYDLKQDEFIRDLISIKVLFEYEGAYYYSEDLKSLLQ